MNKLGNKKIKKVFLLLIGLIVVVTTIFIFVAMPKLKLKSKSVPAQKTGCIKNKDQAVEILLGTDIDWEYEPPTATYKRQVETRGNQIFFDEYSNDALTSGTELVNYLNIGEELKNGSKLLHARYSYKVGLCDIDLDKEEISPQEGEKKYQFSFVNNDGANDQFVDETKTCTSFDPKTQSADLDGDGQKEIIADCYSGGTSLSLDLYAYRLRDNKLDELGQLNTRSSYEVKDCDGDNILDIVSHFRATDVKDCDTEKCFEGDRMLTVLYCNHWNKQKNEFVETKIGEN